VSVGRAVPVGGRSEEYGHYLTRPGVRDRDLTSSVPPAHPEVR
jgi:hypothetical protein